MRKYLRRKLEARECEHVRELMSDYVDGDLGSGEYRRVDDHVGICPRCRQMLANLRSTLERLHLLAGSAPPAAEAVDDVTERVRRAWRERV